ncbi:hypothetical protein NBT05_13895 [Aquimarina sp. ERC-38]|uniref:hypothetical protein n=1 Tax=Aquimarina sp. ERC-38 TaxID=2949996 RepID=UPI002246F0C8|nr:hypothetical protein [Aquimarina sp. ERC-38]UZO80035.1 hypothetical protein NBT05_13895 [Aquimarina sp. ERC-38]
MNPASAREIRKALQNKSQQELVEACMRLSRFKKENKELLTYFLFESENEDAYVESIKEFIDSEFALLAGKNKYRYLKAVRKILRISKRFIRYSGKKETEASILLHFCNVVNDQNNSLKRNQGLLTVFKKQLEMAEKAIATLHEDLQYDFQSELSSLKAI